MADLLDANVWLALSAPDHAHFPRARQYWASEADRSVLFCRTTAMALLRLLSSPAALGSFAMEGAAVWRALQTWLNLPEVGWESEPNGLDEFLRQWAGEFGLRGGGWTDAYLAAFCVAGSHRLVSFDHGFQRFPGLRWLHLH